MWFWIKHLSLAFILIGATIYLLTFQDELMNGKAAPAPQQNKASDSTFSSTTSSAATGLSDFYGKIKAELLDKTKSGDGFIINLEKPTNTIDEQLELRSKVVKPGSVKWVGDVEDRRFRPGDTLRGILTNYAAKEGVDLMWRLERDYVIKHYFQVDSNLLDTLDSVAKALDSDFEKEVFAYYCARERAIVIAYDVSEYVKKNCKRAGKKEQ